MKHPFGPAPENVDVLWRCEARRYSVVIDPEADIFGVTDSELEMRWYYVQRRTPKGAWLANRFVLLTARKRWACNTEQEALESFKARKARQIKILTTQLSRAKADLALLDTRMLAV